MTPNPFREALQRDRDAGRLADPSVAEWRYIRRTRHDVDHPLVFEYHGPGDLVHWVADRFDHLDRPGFGAAHTRSFWEGRPSYVPHAETLIARSAAAHRTLLESIDGVEYDPAFHAPQDTYNVQDFHYCTALAAGVRTVLDFGAGYGRQAFLFATELEAARYVAVDAIEQSYMVQRWVFDRLGLLRWEYLDDADRSLMNALAGQSGAFHLPSWRLDLLADGSVDLALFVWSLYEMSGSAARSAIAACERLVRIGGHVYIRDMPHHVSYRFDPERRLRAAGFELVYASRALTGAELHGRQRLYRRTRARAGAAVRAVGAGRRRGRRLRATWGGVAEGRRQRRERRG